MIHVPGIGFDFIRVIRVIRGKKGFKARLPDTLALLALAAVAWAAAGFLLRADLFIYGDHPGHYWVMWYTLNVAWPLHHRLIDWIPYWYAGYPELQFYPPGFVLLGWLLNLVTFGQIATVVIYEIVAFTAYALPGITFYYAVRHLKFGVRAAFMAGLLGLVFPAFFDGATALFIGMTGSRLAWALDALVLVWAVDFLDGRGARYGVLTVLVLTAAILAHPYHEFGMLLALGLYILVRRMNVGRAGARLLAVLLLAVGLDAFWLAPLVAYTSTAMIPLIRSTLDQVWRLLVDPSLWPLMLCALPAVVRLVRERDAAQRAILAVLVALPLLLGAGMLLIHVIVIDRLHFYQLDPVRLIGEYYFALLLLAAIGISEVATWSEGAKQETRQYLTRRMNLMRRIVANVIALGMAAYFALPFLQSAQFYQPRANDEPRFLSQATADYKLDDLWKTLQATPGRVLYVSALTRLNARGTEPFPTTITALTPLFAGRAMLGGTYSHWSPIGAFMWTGQMNPRVLWGLADDQDDRVLFGLPLEQLTSDRLAEYARRYNITAIVASVNDYETRTWLDASPRFWSYYNNGFFFVYGVRDDTGEWIEARGASVELVASADDRMDLRVRSAGADAGVEIKSYAYPSWHAYTSDGRSLTTRMNEAGLLQITLPPGENYDVTVRYEPGAADQVGGALSLASGVIGLLCLAFIYRNGRGVSG